MNTPTVRPLPAFTDNYVWLLESDGAAVVVDPGDARPVQAALRESRLRLTGILITHHHPDHIGGLPELLSAHDVPVYGPAAEAATIRRLTRPLGDGDRISLEPFGLDLQVLEVPGHTLGHIAYHGAGARHLFCGDTLFSAGCGRLFEGTPEQMHASLSKLAALPDDTAVFCTHEYTLANLAFAAAVEPENGDIQSEIRRARGRRGRGEPTLPSTLGLERRINPFLRCSEPAVVRAAETHAHQPLESPERVFAVLRRWKDGFKAPATV